MSPKKVELKEYEYLEVYAIFKELTTAKIIPSQLSPTINKTIAAIIGSIPRTNIFPP